MLPKSEREHVLITYALVPHLFREGVDQEDTQSTDRPHFKGHLQIRGGAFQRIECPTAIAHLEPGATRSRDLPPERRLTTRLGIGVPEDVDQSLFDDQVQLPERRLRQSRRP